MYCMFFISSRMPGAISIKFGTHITYSPKKNTLGKDIPSIPRGRHGKMWHLKIIKQMTNITAQSIAFMVAEMNGDTPNTI